MFLVLIYTLCFVGGCFGLNLSEYYFNNHSSINDCPEFGKVDHGTVRLIENELFFNSRMEIQIECDSGYDLTSSGKIICENGEWQQQIRPQCIPRCTPPPHVKNGAVEIDGDKDEKGLYPKGTLATYSCIDGYELSPIDSQYRVCEKGLWTGAYVSCNPVVKITECKPPKDIADGYFVHEKYGVFDGYNVGQRLHYSCNSGYVLSGSPVQQCLDDGSWSPRIQPVCIPKVVGKNIFRLYLCAFVIENIENLVTFQIFSLSLL